MYEIVKTVHIISVILFLGNIVTGLFWKNFADRTGNAAIQAHALAGVIRSDALFTLPSVVVILGSGAYLTSLAGLPIFGTRWISYSLIAFGISGLLFAAFLAPIQKRLFSLARTGTEQGAWPSADYRRLSVQWEVIGVVAILLPLAALVMMVLKPW